MMSAEDAEAYAQARADETYAIVGIFVVLGLGFLAGLVLGFVGSQGGQA